MTQQWTSEGVLEIARAFQPACVLVAGAELGLFDALAKGAGTAHDVSSRLGTDTRATTMLLDALTAMELLAKNGGRYEMVHGVADALTGSGSDSVLAMVRHMGTCLRHWAQLGNVTITGRRADRTPSIRGAEADMEAFIEAMNEISRAMAPGMVQALGPPVFQRLLDVGGGPGTWTIAFLECAPQAMATLFDLPDVIPIAQKHIVAAGLADRVRFVAGDFDADAALPGPADLAWVSAIVHMNSRDENRALFAKVRGALVDGGQILIRDVIMEESRTSPREGAMFAINMLVNTPGGGTYTFAELSEDLCASGFSDPVLVMRGDFMDSVVRAVRSSV